MAAAVVLACAAAHAAQLVGTDALAAGAIRSGATTAASSCRGAQLQPSQANARAVAAATLCLVNRMRATYGLRAVHSNRTLGDVAASQVTSMVDEDYFGDDRPSGQTPLSLIVHTRYPAHSARLAIGQNIAWGTGVDATPAQIVARWMASPPHREIMLSAAYRDAGVAVTPAVPAVVHAQGLGATYAMEFGARRY